MIELNCIRLGGSCGGGVTNALSKDEVITVIREKRETYVMIFNVGDEKKLFENFVGVCSFAAPAMYGTKIGIFLDGEQVAEAEVQEYSKVSFNYSGHEGSLLINDDLKWRYEDWSEGNGKPLTIIFTAIMGEIDYSIEYTSPIEYTIIPLLNKLLGLQQ